MFLKKQIFSSLPMHILKNFPFLRMGTADLGPPGSQEHVHHPQCHNVKTHSATPLARDGHCWDIQDQSPSPNVVDMQVQHAWLRCLQAVEQLDNYILQSMQPQFVCANGDSVPPLPGPLLGTQPATQLHKVASGVQSNDSDSSVPAFVLNDRKVRYHVISDLPYYV